MDSQKNNTSNSLFEASSKLAENFHFESVKLISNPPVSRTKVSNGLVTIELLYGPPEFHVELFLNYLEHRLRFADLFRDPNIKEWATNNQMKGEKSIEAEVSWYSKFLADACTDVFSNPKLFFSRIG